jgi:peptide/nickel transport system substrate-binding protein
MKRTRLLAGLAIGSAAMLALTACADRGGASGEGGSSFAPVKLVDSLPAATTPVDEVKWAVVEGDDPLDPITTSSVIRPNLCESLLLLGADYSVSPNLATGAEWVNPVTFVIDLRDDVTFWDGTPMTPEDVIYSMSRNLNPMSLYYG